MVRWDGLQCDPFSCPDCALRQCAADRTWTNNEFEVYRAGALAGCALSWDGGSTAVADCSGRCTLMPGQCSTGEDAGRPSVYGACANLGQMRNDCAWN